MPSPVVQLRVPPEVLARLDSALQHGESRSSWIVEAIRMRLGEVAGEVVRRPAERARASSLPPGRAPVAESSSRPRAEPGKCRHPRALRGWCNDCKTGGHY